VLRACIVNFHTGEADVDALPEIVARLGRAVDAALRNSGDRLSNYPSQTSTGSGVTLRSQRSR